MNNNNLLNFFILRMWRTNVRLVYRLPTINIINKYTKIQNFPCIHLLLKNIKFYNLSRYLSNVTPVEHVVNSILDHATFERVCTATLESLNDYFEQLIESVDYLPHSDVAYSDGVLTVHFGSNYGTYVINRQAPNRQIWLSSPKSGPKRYDFIGCPTGERGKWVYRHTGQSLHELLQTELQYIFQNNKLQFNQLSYSK